MSVVTPSTPSLSTPSSTAGSPSTNGTSPPYSRPMYLKRVPEEIWIRTHDNANRSRLSLQAFVVKLLANSGPFDPLDPPAFA